MTGTGGIRAFNYTAIYSGNSTMRFIYARSWDIGTIIGSIDGSVNFTAAIVNNIDFVY